MFQALVIGCGNIGALYDLNSSFVLTHSKALHNNPNFALTVFDTNKHLARRIAEKYNAQCCDVINSENLAKFDCLSICTPTKTHLYYLDMAFRGGTKLILCEKPVSGSMEDLILAEALYSSHSSKVLVNYMRRFQPEYMQLQRIINSLLQQSTLTNISITYQRGFMNNCSHAFDTLEFLLKTEIELDDLKIHNKVFDQFEDDPTLSLQAKWRDVNVCIHGLSDVKFSNFEIDLYFENYRVSLTESGNTIEVFKSPENVAALQPLIIQKEYTRESALRNFMEPVIDQAYKILIGQICEDNFMQSVNMNKRLFTYQAN